MPPKKSPPVPRVPLFSKTILRLQKGVCIYGGFWIYGGLRGLGDSTLSGFVRHRRYLLHECFGDASRITGNRRLTCFDDLLTASFDCLSALVCLF